MSAKRKLISLISVITEWEEEIADENLDGDKKRKRMWTKERFGEGQREMKGVYFNLLQELALHDQDEFRRYIRMDNETFLELVRLIKPIIKKQDTVMRQSISPEERLTVTLRYLATGESFRSLSGQFRISDRTISKFVPEVCDAIYQILQTKYMSVPSTKEQWLEIGQKFETLWNFPHCVGAIDGKHINILPPKNTGSFFYNYKHDFSIVLMAIVDADYKFTFVDVGTNGRISDGGVWRKTMMSKCLEDNSLNLPDPKAITENGPNLPYVFVADEAFSMKAYLMRPYSSRELTDAKRIYNYRLSRARRVVENTFGILANRWRVLRSTIALEPMKVEKVVLAICTLHNFLRSKTSARKTYTPAGIVDMEDVSTGAFSEGSWRSSGLGDGMRPLGPPSSNAYGKEAKRIRDEFCKYFNTAGSVSWQWSN